MQTMGTLADPNGSLEKMMKRKLKNRASAARSHARKLAYINQLEIEVSILREKLESHDKQKEMESHSGKPPSSSDASIQNSPTAREPLFPSKSIKTEPDLAHVNGGGQAPPSSSHVSVQNNPPTAQEPLSVSKIKTESDLIHDNSRGETNPSGSHGHASLQKNFPTAQESLVLYKSVHSEQTLVKNSEEIEMAEVSTEESSKRVAIAGCRVILGEGTFNLVASNQINRGDVLNIAKIAGIMGAKQTSNLIPLSQGVCLADIHLNLTLNRKDFAVEIEGEVSSTVERGGVEMEAMTAVTVAGLTVYDMCKATSQDVRITDICLKQQTGGRGAEQRNQICNIPPGTGY